MEEETGDTEGLVVNLHERLALPSIDCQSEELALVQGRYYYCHFGQQGLNDAVIPLVLCSDIFMTSKMVGMGMRVPIDANVEQLVLIE